MNKYDSMRQLLGTQLEKDARPIYMALKDLRNQKTFSSL
jgi:hypothetical protein